MIRRIDARKALESQRPRCCGALTKCRRRDSNPDARIMIPDDFGLAIGDPRRIGHAVGHNRTLGGTPFRVRRHRRSRPRAWSVERCCGALLGGKARKRRTCRTFFEAAEGTRTLDLLHGKQTLIVGSYRFIPTYRPHRRLRCAVTVSGFAAFRRSSGTQLAPETRDAGPSVRSQGIRRRRQVFRCARGCCPHSSEEVMRAVLVDIAR